MVSPAPSTSPAPPAPLSDASELKGCSEEPFPPAAALSSTYQICGPVKLIVAVFVTVPAVGALPSVTVNENESLAFVYPTLGVNTKSPWAWIVTNPPSAVATVPATKVSAFGPSTSLALLRLSRLPLTGLNGPVVVGAPSAGSLTI